MRPTTNTIGRRGESLAAKLLKKAGHRIVTTNYTCPIGEIDIIALDRDEIVFVEVKALHSGAQADPEDHVDRRKQEKIRHVARYYLHAARAEERPCRFDVIAVTFSDSDKPMTRHYKDAF